MRSRSVAVGSLLVAVAPIVASACGSGDEGATPASPPVITLVGVETSPPTAPPAPTGPEGSTAATTPDGTDGGSGAPSTSVAPTGSTDGAAAASTTPGAGAGSDGGPTATTGSGGSPAAAPAATTASPTSTTTAATSTTASVESRFELTTTGIGSTTFGADPEGTIAFIGSFLGAPTSDTGWVDPFDIGVCDGNRLRRVGWADLVLEFADVSDVTEGRDHFVGYTYGREGSSSALPPALSTPEGLTVGSTVGDLLVAYPGVQLIEGDEFMAPSFTVNDALSGRLSGLGSTDLVEVVIGGRPCES